MQRELRKHAKNLRRNMTDAERMLWRNLRSKNLGVKFRRQEPIGSFIVDFVCFEKRVIIEVDGGQHSESKKDGERDDWFREQNFKVLRFWNNEVIKNEEGVMQVIMENLSPSPHPSHEGRGEGNISSE